MTFIVDGTNGLTFPNSTTQASAGQVLQVVNSTLQITGAYFQTTSTSLTATGQTITITPKFSTSKILLTCSGILQTSSGQIAGYATIYRGGTNLVSGGSPGAIGYIRNSTTGTQTVQINMQIYDSPATTSATTYQVYVAGEGGATITWGGVPGALSGSILNFTAMEIAA